MEVQAWKLRGIGSGNTVTEQVKVWSPYSNSFTYTIYLPRDTSWSPERSLQLTQSLLSAFPVCMCRISATSQRIIWQVIDWGQSYSEQQIVLTIRLAYPEAVVERGIFVVREKEYPIFRTVRAYTVDTNPLLRDSPLMFVSDLREHEPLIALAQAMNSLLPNEQMHFTVLCAGVSRVTTTLGLIASIAGDWFELETAQGLEYKARRLIEEKFHAPHYSVVLALEVESPLKERVIILESLVEPVLTNGFARLSPVASLRRFQPLSEPEVATISSMQDDLHTGTLGLYTKYLRKEITFPSGAFVNLIPEEIAALWHLPHRDMTASQIYWIEPIKGELPEVLVGKNDGVCFGYGRVQDREAPAFIPDMNRRTHMSVLGGSGAGKSTFLHNLIHQDIAQGKGLAVIDPHGTLVEAILQQSIPSEREDDVVVIDLSQREFPPPLNPFRFGGEQGNAGKILRAVEMASGTGNYARLKKFLQAAVQTVSTDPEATMRDLSRVFRDDEYRSNLLTHIDNPILDETWGDYELYNVSTQEAVRDPVLSRINPFYGNPALYLMFCHPHALDFAELIRQRKIILISLHIDSRSMSKEEEEMIGALFISHLQMAGTEQRSDLTIPPFYIYIDEVERFVNDALDTILSEARKRGLALILAHQYLYQIRGNLLKSVMANVDTRIVFRCSLEDAREYTPYMGGQFSVDDIVTLSNHNAIVKTQFTPQQEASPISLPGFGIRTLEPMPLPSDAKEREARIRARSIAKYTPLSASDVKAWLDHRYPRRRSRPSGEQDYYE